MAAIRVSVCGMPPLLRSMVLGILESDPDIELVEPKFPSGETETVDAQVLLMAESAVCEMRPFERPWSDGQSLGIIALSNDCQQAAIIQIVSHNANVSGHQMHTLNQAVRRAASLLARPN
jgi:hypothetical protein